MRQVLHLLILDRDCTRALAAMYGTRWLLPVLTCDERARAGSAAVQWAAGHGMVCDVAGQWLGRVSSDAMDWLVTMILRDSPGDLDAKLAWTPLVALSSLAALLEYQGWAVVSACTSGSHPSTRGPFGNVDWIDRVKEWIGASAGASCCALIPYRVTPHEVTLGAETCGGRVYFKGLTDERVAEACLTRALVAVVPDSFARTLALEERPDGTVWWLTAECPGRTAVGAVIVARELARVQRRVMASGPVLRELKHVNFEPAVRWACDLVGDVSCAEAIRKHARFVMKADLPESWIPMDLDPTNVLVDECGDVHFIDLDESYFGPAPLAMATFAKRCRDTSIYRVYEQSWSPPLTDVGWPSFEVTAAVFEAWRGLQRIEQNTRRGEVHGAFDLAVRRIRERLARIVHRR